MKKSSELAKIETLEIPAQITTIDELGEDYLIVVNGETIPEYEPDDMD